MNDVIEAWADIARATAAAEARYRATLRAAIADGVKQAEISRKINRSREALRRDAMSEDERAAFLAAEADRLRRMRATREAHT